MRFPHPVVICDIGGTNVRVAIAHKEGDPPDLLAHLKTADFPDLAGAVEAAMTRGPARARALVACGAGPIGGRALHLTNANWLIDGPVLAERLNLAQGLLLNDFEAQAIQVGERAFGLQFHPDVTYAMICKWTVVAHERMNQPGAQKRERHIDGWFQYDGAVARWTSAFLRRWLGPAENEGEFVPAE